MSELKVFAPLADLLSARQQAVEESQALVLAMKQNPKATEFLRGSLDYANQKDLDLLEPKIKAIDLHYWQEAMTLSNFFDVMPMETRKAWRENLNNGDYPTFTPDCVYPTLKELFDNRDRYFAEKVDSVFHSLSREHVTNCPQGFGKRIILQAYSYCSGYWSINEKMRELFSVVGQCYGLGTKYEDMAYRLVDNMPNDGEWRWVCGNICKIRKYKKGTIHVELHYDVVIKLNQQLHKLYPMAIPEKFRNKPLKTPKVPDLQEIAVNPKLCENIAQLKIAVNANGYELVGNFNRTELEVLDCIGATVKDRDNKYWKVATFDYNPKDVLLEILLNGSIPDYKTYQYYPTPDHIASQVQAIANIHANDRVLEPSAGNGNLVLGLTNPLTLVELSSVRTSVLKTRFGSSDVYCQDFLQWKNPTGYDVILMNPPFTGNQAQAHIKRAFTMLNPKGRLVAVVPAGFDTKKLGNDIWESAPIHNAFRYASVSVKLIKWVK